MKSTTAFAKRELVIVLGCVVFLLMSIGAIGDGGRRRAKRAVCLANLKQLTLAWNIYADDNDDKIVNGDTEEYLHSHYREVAWVRKDWQPGMTVEQRQQAIENGALFPYTKELRLYRCPSGPREETRGYAVVDAMNCKGWSAMNGVMIKKRSEISNPAERFVFLDHGGNAPAMLGGWTCYVRQDRWWDPPPIRHDEGATFSFADGHSEYWKWKDPRTVTFGRQMTVLSELQPGNEDIRRVQVAAWGSAAIQ